MPVPVAGGAGSGLRSGCPSRAAPKINSLPSWLLKAVVGPTEASPAIQRLVNQLAIDSSVTATRNRPHPWNTVHDHVSWESLTDKRCSARHLPARKLPAYPDSRVVAPPFRRPADRQKPSDESAGLFPAFAQYLTDGFIRTRMPDTSAGEKDEVRLQTTSNHQIGPCPLHGRTREQTPALRLPSPDKGRKGRLKCRVIAGGWGAFLCDGAPIREEFAAPDRPLGEDAFTDDTARRSRIFAFSGDRGAGPAQHGGCADRDRGGGDRAGAAGAARFPCGPSGAGGAEAAAALQGHLLGPRGPAHPARGL